MKSTTLFRPSKIFKDWLIHFGIALLLVNSMFVFHYFLGFHELQAGFWQYIIDHNLNPRDLGFLIALTLLAELNYQLFFEANKLEIFFFSSCTTGMILTGFLLLFPRQSGNIHVQFITIMRGPLIFLVLYPLLYGFIRNYFADRIRRAELESKQFETELNSLKAQVNPHFFFNTFNYLYGTALLEKAEKTAEGIEMMSSMMRYTLTGMQKSYVPLAEELEFLETYITLQRLRIPLSDKIQLDFNISKESESLLIAPLLLIPFVENAFKYGLSVQQPCRIMIHVLIKDNTLEFISENTIISSESISEGTNNGIYLTKKRLQLLYQGRHRLECAAHGNMYKVNLKINL